MSTVVEAVLVVHSGPDYGQTIPLTGSSIVMGRGLDCEVVVSDRGVSRNHAVLVRPEAGYHLRDLCSTNGTFLNDERIDDRDHLLRNSDTIGFGQGDVSYVYHSPTAETIRLTLEPTTDVLPVTAAETIAQVGQADEPHAQEERV